MHGIGIFRRLDEPTVVSLMSYSLLLGADGDDDDHHHHHQCACALMRSGFVRARAVLVAQPPAGRPVRSGGFTSITTDENLEGLIFRVLHTKTANLI